MKEVLGQVSRVDRHAVTNLYGAAWRVNAAYLPNTARDGDSECCARS
jgi:hypothetical protein